VYLRIPEEHLNYSFDPDSKKGFRLPLPHPETKPVTRIINERQSDGTLVRHFEFLSAGQWIEGSTVKCNADNIMIEKKFTAFKPDGSFTIGEVIQTDINISRLPDSLFRIPSDVQTVQSGTVR
jgi:hypothetical protein